MNSVRQSCRPKHQVLILKCYPRFQKGVQSVKPNSSELSYLLYYASTRRSKLQKVGAFLEKRAARDVWRGKLGNVQVTLQILAALIEKVPRDLPLYARSILTVLDIVLRSREISMVEETIPTFELFCRHQDSATLTADHEYIIQYRELVGTYASFASTETPVTTKTPMSAPMALRWRTVGLKAIKSIVTSEILSTDGAKQLNVVIPVILQNLYASGDHRLSPLQEKAKSSERLEREQFRRRRMSISTVQTVDTIDGNGDPESASGSAADADMMAEMEARVLALRCLEKVFSGTNRVQIRFATSLVLSFIVSRRPPRTQEKQRSANGKTDGNWATNLLEVIANWSPVQDRFIILVTLLETLVERPLVDGQLEPQLTLASMMDWLLGSSVNLIGLSVMDVLIGLLQFVRQLLQLGNGTQTLVPHHGLSTLIKPLPQMDETAATNSQTNGENEKAPTADSLRHELLELLENCIGNLATHVYYGDQVSDMIRTIVIRIKPSPALEGENAHHESESDNAIQKSSPSRSDYTAESYFSSSAARITALRSVKDILVVANLRKSTSGTDPDARNRVPLHVWEGTHWLLQDPQWEVPNARACERSCPPPLILMKLQDTLPSSVSASKALHIGSLVHGYLLALVEKFDLEGTRPAAEIINEISKRKKRGVWLDKIQLPPRPLHHIQPSLDTVIEQASLPQPDKNIYSRFTSLEELVRQIESTYNSSYVSPPISPSNSPGRSFSIPSLGLNNSTNPHVPAGSQLPLHVKEHMLAPWSKEACLDAIEKEKAKTSSLSGSRTATGAFAAGLNALNMSAYNSGPGSPTGTAPSASNRQDRPVSAAYAPTGNLAGFQKTRRQSIPERRVSPAASSRDSTVRVNELRRVLSVINSSNVRHPSPLRGRHRVDSTVSSTESMVSDNLSFSDAGTAAADRPLSSRENLTAPRGLNRYHGGPNQLHGDFEPEYIPPVPPLPSSLAIPGGFPADSRSGSSVTSPSHSPPRSDRPSTAPGRPARTHSKSKGSNASTLRQSRSLSRKKSLDTSLHERSERRATDLNGIPSGHSHGYSEDLGDIGIAITADTTEIAPHTQDRADTSSQWSRREASRTLSFGRRVDMDKLLEGLSAPNDDQQPNGTGEVSGIKIASSGVEGSSSLTRMGKKPSFQSMNDEKKASYSRKTSLLSPGAAPWNRLSSDRGGIGPPPY
ncbi:efr3 [Coccidioides immitis RMSCC 3703]|uniref:Efr3 n=1 Tax=Coccidioides immitis RMSCC 3703 TaxID=454286 RepID=A0A0J8R1H5_COCIT|nr:efr3 [Coccidioides immitis RMSCC 3703]